MWANKYFEFSYYITPHWSASVTANYPNTYSHLSTHTPNRIPLASLRRTCCGAKLYLPAGRLVPIKFSVELTLRHAVPKAFMIAGGSPFFASFFALKAFGERKKWAAGLSNMPEFSINSKKILRLRFGIPILTLYQPSPRLLKRINPKI